MFANKSKLGRLPGRLAAVLCTMVGPPTTKPVEFVPIYRVGRACNPVRAGGTGGGIKANSFGYILAIDFSLADGKDFRVAFLLYAEELEGFSVQFDKL